MLSQAEDKERKRERVRERGWRERERVRGNWRIEREKRKGEGGRVKERAESPKDFDPPPQTKWGVGVSG